MKKEISIVLELVHVLKQKYTSGQCTQCAVMQDYLKSEYLQIKLKLQSLETLVVNNNNTLKDDVVLAQKESAILGLYVMV